MMGADVECIEVQGRAVELEGVAVDDPVGLYLRETGPTPLLTGDQEVALARRMEAGRAAQEELERDGIGGHRRAELRSTVQDGLAARSDLIRANTRLVVSVAKRYTGRGVELPDLIQEGNVGLIRAVDGFRHELGFRLSTYATWWIRQGVARAVADQGRTIRVPVHTWEEVGRFAGTRSRLVQELGGEPGDEQIAAAMGTTATRVAWLRRVARRPLSLEMAVGYGGELGEFVECEGPTPAASMDESSLGEDLAIALSSLTERHRRVLTLYYYGLGGETFTMEDVAAMVGVTRERVRQIIEEGLAQLRGSAPVMRRLAVYRP